MTLPVLLSVPHAGLRVPPEAMPYCRLEAEQIEQDGDQGAGEIYQLPEEVAAYLSTDVARAIVDLNRAVGDRSVDGVVKTHTCWGVAVYDEFPPETVVAQLLERYYHPYHNNLESLFSGELILGVDCHTMASIGPPVAPDPGQRRPWVCLSDADGRTLPAGWMDLLACCFERTFDGQVSVNSPFHGGSITRQHGQNAAWVQLELSRGDFLSNTEKRERVLCALRAFCQQVRL